MASVILLAMMNAALPDDPGILKRLLLQQQQAYTVLQQKQVEQQRMHMERAVGMQAQLEDVAAQAVASQVRIATFEQAAREWESQRAELTQRLLELQRKNDHLAMDKMRLEYRLTALMRRHYGPRADQVGSGQMLLEFVQLLEEKPLALPPDVLAEGVPAAGESQTLATPARHIHRGRRNVRDMTQLPVKQYRHELPESQRACPVCQALRQEMGHDTSWQIEYIPAHLVRVEHIQVKYVCRCCEQSAADTGSQIIQAEKPMAPIDKGLPGPGLLAHVVTSKFADHLPLYRLEGMFDRQGFEVTRSTMCQWMADVADLVKPVYDAMVREVKQSHVVATDDTIMPMLEEKKTKKARMWIYRGDDAHAHNVFAFTESRSRDGPAEFLRGFDQVLLADAYGGYDGICVEGGMTKAGCWAHARRKFVDAHPMAPDIANEALLLMGQLFGLERQARQRDLDAQSHLALRQKYSVPILEQLQKKLEHWRLTVLPKHPVNMAIGYCLNQWKSLEVFTRDPAVRIDNNLAEQEMKRIALGRKNFLFVGSPRGGQTAAILASITSTCRRHQINPELYLTQLLANLPSTLITKVNDWLPDVWKSRQLAENKSVQVQPAG